ncbi:SphA family protein [Allorhizobium undicola]|uniref:SphA family protein n=1 Tax=Allorhizobium undicola TaxID=78527 RepID=UPI00137794FC|nr:transporter [Allorhizobium undicola]
MQAAENGNTQYSPGSAQFYAGGIPPYPGFYFLSQTSYYSADRTNDSNGDKIPINFKVDAFTETMRFLYVSDLEVGGGQLFGQVILPFVHLDLTTPGGSDKSFALADLVTTVGLSWHVDPKNSFTLGLDVAMPTGSYDSNDIANVGLNHWSFQPVAGYHYKDPQGFELGATARLIFNTRNNDTDYKSGTEFVFDYAVGWNFDAHWRVGAVGYYLQQLTDDTGPTAAADGHRGKGFSIGPSLTYTINPGQELSASWQPDIVSENRAQGNMFWVNFATKF